MKTKSLLLFSALGLAFLGLSQTSSATYWETGPCEGNHTNPGPAPCFDYYDDSADQWHHFNGDGGHADSWHGSPLGGDLEYCGVTTLSCDGVIPVEAECELCLYGQVRKCEDDNGDWRIGIKIVDGTVTPIDFFCNFIDVEGFPWYAGPDNYSGPYNEDCEVGIVYTQPPILVGSFGNIDVPTVGVSDGHIHNVSYNNLDSFTFDNDILVGSPGTSTDCRVDGVLRLQPIGDILEIH